MDNNYEEIIEADTIEEALVKAEQLLNVDRDKLDIEYISNGSSGFLGIGKKPIIIKAKYKTSDNENDNENDNDNENLQTPVGDVDGSVSVIDGKVLVTDPEGTGKHPSITAGKNVEIYINGSRITNTTNLCEDDLVEIEVSNVAAEASYTIEIAKDKMFAFLIIKKRLGKNYKINNSPSALHIEVSAAPEEVIPIIDFTQVESALKKLNIVFGIKHQEIINALNSREEDVKIVAAEGLLPAGGEQYGIEYIFIENKNKSKQDQEKEHESRYSTRKIFSVDKGDVLAVNHVPTNKNNGKNIMGVEIPYIEEGLIVGKGIELINDGKVAVAAVPGSPLLEGKKLSVIPVYIIQGDLDFKVGNLNFNGDINVRGNVTEGFKVEAKGGIDVLGNVSFSSLYAYKDIHIHKKALSANVHAGVIGDYRSLSKELNFLLDRITSLTETAKLVKQNLDEKNYGQFIQLLIDKKFHSIPITINKFVTYKNSKNNELTIQTNEVIAALEQKFCNLGPLRIKNVSELDSAVQDLQKAIEEIDLLAQNKSNIIVDYVQNSVITASGDISITGAGSLTSELKAGRSIYVPIGSVRGGFISAYEKIEVAELGASSSAEINIKLLGNCILHAKKVNPSIAIEHGVQKVIIDRHCRNLKAYLNNDGVLEIEELKF